MAQENLASKSDISDFIKKTDFDDKLKNLNKNVTSNKNELNQLPKKVKAISLKGLTKDLTNKFSTFNRTKYFSSRIFQNYWVLIPAKTTLNILMALLGLIYGNLMKCQKSNSAPTFVDHYVLPDIDFNGHCLIKNNISILKKVMNLYISYMLNPWLRNWNTDSATRICKAK